MRRALVVLGVVLIGYGAVGLVTADRGPAVLRYLAFFGAGVLAHDLLLAPVALGVGVLVGRWAPTSLRGPVLAGLFASVAVSVVALPFVLGYGYRPDLPSALPHNYGRGLAIILAGIWLGIALVVLLRRWSRRRIDA
ncbi:MAG: hypothetical protein ACRDT4_25400 [Micromonosporaceae bacterium]